MPNTPVRYNASRTGNQQGSSRGPRGNPSETTRRAPLIRAIVKAYLFGALHDGTRRPNGRVRFGQKDIQWLQELQRMLKHIGYRSWLYREGRKRQFHILESVASIFREPFYPARLQTSEEQIAYLQGFFDAEGGVPRSLKAPRYIQLVQKNREKITLIKRLLQRCGITTGVPHNPSKRIDPDYWRIFVRRKSIQDFARIVGSRHPRKRAVFQEWMKI